jgi:hypothetical protein
MTSWRESASQQAQDDLDALLNAVLPFAEQTLAKYGELFPFGAALSSQGQLELLAAEPGDGERPGTEAVLQALHDGARVSCGTRRAFAFVADVRADAVDAVRVELEHQEGTAIVVLVPYGRSEVTKEVTFAQMTGSTGHSSVWIAEGK